MDPIHPIVPVTPNIPPVSPAPMSGRIDRDTPRGNPHQEQSRRKRPGSPPAAHATVEGSDYFVDDAGDDDDESGLHINVTA